MYETFLFIIICNQFFCISDISRSGKIKISVRHAAVFQSGIHFVKAPFVHICTDKSGVLIVYGISVYLDCSDNDLKTVLNKDDDCA